MQRRFHQSYPKTQHQLKDHKDELFVDLKTLDDKVSKAEEGMSLRQTTELALKTRADLIFPIFPRTVALEAGSSWQNVPTRAEV